MAKKNKTLTLLNLARKYLLEISFNLLTVGALAYLAISTGINPSNPMQLVAPIAVAVAMSYLIVNRNSVLLRRVEDKLDLIHSAEGVREISKNDIGDELRKLLENSYEWEFFGGTGNWQKSNVLPHLSSIKDRDVKYVARIPNPFNNDLCVKYSEYRIKSRDQYNKTGDQISIEILAFVVLICFYSSISRIKADVYFNNHFSPIRIEGNSEFKILTVADPEKTGLFVGDGHWLNNSLVDDINYRSGAKIEIREGSGGVDEIDNISKEFIEDVLRRYFTGSALLEKDQDLKSVSCEKILKEIKNGSR